MANVGKIIKGNHSRWLYTSFTIICMVSTFVLGCCLLQEFVAKLLLHRKKDELYDDIMHTGLIVCIFNISKFYLLLYSRKKLEIVDLIDSGTDEISEEKNNGTENAFEEERDDHEVETQDQVIDGQQDQGLRREQDDCESRADMDTEQNEEQNIPEIQDSQNLQDLHSTNRQDSEQVQGQIKQDNNGSEEHVLALDDIQVHIQDSESRNIQPRRSTMDRTNSSHRRSQSMGEGQCHESLRRPDDQINEPHKLHRSMHQEDPGSSKSSQKIKSPEKKHSLYALRHRSCFPKEKP